MQTESLIHALRDARVRKGWSQRELSKRAHLPQAHLSRIENGAVDLKLSTFLELARLLDFEPVLAPRTAVSAVSALLREADANRDARSVRGATNRLHQLVRQLRLEHPKAPLAERLNDLTLGLHHLEPILRSATDLSELLDIADQIEAAARRGEDTAIRRNVDRLANLRNRLAHQGPDAQRPAYTLDDED